MERKKIIVIGSVNNDLVIGVNKAPVLGETVLGSGFIQVSGGKGANQAVACARLGADVTFIGAVGDDSFGSLLINNLKDNNVFTGCMKAVPHHPTGTAMIIVYGGDNYIAVDQGANLTVDKPQIDAAEQWIKDADMAVLQLEIPYDTVWYAIGRCKTFGIPVLLNPAPAPAQPLSRELLSMVDLLTPNESETFALTGIKPSSPEEAVRAAKRLSGLGAKQVVITLGGDGCVYGSDMEFRHMPAIKADKVVDTTAAGDAFTAALAVALTNGWPLEEAAAFATKAGAITVTQKGAQPSLPYLDDVYRQNIQIHY